MVVGNVESPFGTEVNGFKVTTNWGGKGAILDPSTQDRVYDEWKKVDVKETKISNTHIIIESKSEI